MTPFLENLKIIAASPQDVVQWLREGNVANVYVEKRAHPRC
jgi:hypothetical protein